MFMAYSGQVELSVNGYTDPSVQIDRDGSQSKSGLMFLMNKGSITWKSFKKDTIVDSTTESKYSG